MIHFALVCFVFICGGIHAAAQMQLVSSVPESGAVDVNATSTVSFTFSMPLDQDYQFSSTQLPIYFNEDNLGSLTIDNVLYSPDGKTISFDVEHPENSPVAWLIMGAKAEDGETLDHPYAINYTTAEAAGTASLEGTVINMDGESTNAMVALGNHSLFSDALDIRMLYSAVIDNEQGGYTIENIEDGVYWPVTILDINGNGEISVDDDRDLIGYYDPNNDRVPDSIVVEGGNVSGVNMELRELHAEFTARDLLSIADARAAEYASDQKLRGVFSVNDAFETDGFSIGWMYVYYSPSGEFPTRVTVAPTTSDVDTSATTEPMLPINFTALPGDFIDSDEAASIMVNGGGQTVMDTADILTSVGLYGGDFGEAFGLSVDHVWVGEYRIVTQEGASSIRDTIYFFVDMETGELVSGSSSVDEVVAHDGIMLQQNFPNPASDETVIIYTVEKPTEIHLALYDMQGRELMVLVDERTEIGEYATTVDVDNIPSGLYLYRLTTPTGSISRQITVLK